jgi:hypothetical protein
MIIFVLNIVVIYCAFVKISGDVICPTYFANLASLLLNMSAYIFTHSLVSGDDNSISGLVTPIVCFVFLLHIAI